MLKSTRNLALIGIILLVLGLGAWGMQLFGGLLAGSGMTNIFLWGLMIAMFAFMVGFGAGAQIVSTIIYIWGKPEWKPTARLASVIGLACVVAAGVAILADLGAIRNVMAMIVGLNLRSPLAWDMLAISAFIIASVVQLVVIARGGASYKVWAAVAGVAAVVLQIVEGLLFSTQHAHEWWATPIMPIDFLMVALVSGSALLLLIACIQNADKKLTAWLGRVCASAIAIHLVLAFSDFTLMFIKHTAVSQGILDVLLAYLPLYAAELLLPAVAMVLLMTKRRRQEMNYEFVAAILTIVGIFAHRLMLLYPAYNAPSLYLTLSGTDITTGAYPLSTGRYLDWDTTFTLATPYLPNIVECVAALLPLGVAIVGTFVILWGMERIK